MKKYIFCFLIISLFVINLNRVSAQTKYEIVDSKGTYYQGERITTNLFLDVPHNTMSEKYFIVNSKTNKKTQLGTFKHESMSQGSGAGMIIDQKPGTYYYLSILSEGSKKQEYKTDEFTIINKNKTPKIKIENFNVEFEPIPYYEQKTDQEYKLNFKASSILDMGDVFSKINVKCSRPVSFYEKGGEMKCSKNNQKLIVSGNNFDYAFLIDEDDLSKDVTLKLEYVLENNFGKKLDKVKETILLSKFD